MAFTLAFTLVGVLVARRQSRNPMGWLLIAVALSVAAGNVASAHAYLDYTLHHGSLPLDSLAVLLCGSWEYAFILLPLIILLSRRFNRARYDAEAIAAHFSARLRDAVELDTIRAELLAAVNSAVQPTHASVWIRPHARGWARRASPHTRSGPREDRLGLSAGVGQAGASAVSASASHSPRSSAGISAETSRPSLTAAVTCGASGWRAIRIAPTIRPSSITSLP